MKHLMMRFGGEESCQELSGDQDKVLIPQQVSGDLDPMALKTVDPEPGPGIHKPSKGGVSGAGKEAGRNSDDIRSFQGVTSRNRSVIESGSRSKADQKDLSNQVNRGQMRSFHIKRGPFGVKSTQQRSNEVMSVQAWPFRSQIKSTEVKCRLKRGPFGVKSTQVVGAHSISAAHCATIALGHTTRVVWPHSSSSFLACARSARRSSVSI